MADQIEAPNGFVEVTREQFFALLNKAAAIDPMPTPFRHHEEWRALRGHQALWGWCAPGWLEPGKPTRSFVRADYAA